MDIMMWPSSVPRNKEDIWPLGLYGYLGPGGNQTWQRKISYLIIMVKMCKDNVTIQTLPYIISISFRDFPAWISHGVAPRNQSPQVDIPKWGWDTWTTNETSSKVRFAILSDFYGPWLTKRCQDEFDLPSRELFWSSFIRRQDDSDGNVMAVSLLNFPSQRNKASELKQPVHLYLCVCAYVCMCANLHVRILLCLYVFMSFYATTSLSTQCLSVCLSVVWFFLPQFAQHCSTCSTTPAFLTADCADRTGEIRFEAKKLHQWQQNSWGIWQKPWKLTKQEHFYFWPYKIYKVWDTSFNPSEGEVPENMNKTLTSGEMNPDSYKPSAMQILKIARSNECFFNSTRQHWL